MEPLLPKSLLAGLVAFSATSVPVSGEACAHRDSLDTVLLPGASQGLSSTCFLPILHLQCG